MNLRPGELLLKPVSNQKGLAFLTVLMLLLLLTVLGIGAITVTGFDNRIAGLVRTTESAAAAAESCLGTGVNVIQQTMDQGQVPTEVLTSATPAGPVPSGNKATLEQEIMGQSDNNPDTTSSNPPNLQLSVGGFSVTGDIDRLYAKPKAGSGQQQNAAYDGIGVGGGAGGIDIMYRVDCVATNSATGTTSRVTGIYACAMTGEMCQKRL